MACHIISSVFHQYFISISSVFDIISQSFAIHSLVISHKAPEISHVPCRVPKKLQTGSAWFSFIRSSVCAPWTNCSHLDVVCLRLCDSTCLFPKQAHLHVLHFILNNCPVDTTGCIGCSASSTRSWRKDPESNRQPA